MTDIHQRDAIYSTPQEKVESFSFDEKVVSVFPDMIKRSVPGYASILGMIGVLANRYAKDNTLCYDLGCSLGAATLAMRWQIKATGCKIIAVDNSLPMLDRARQNLEMDTANIPVDLICADIRDIKLSNASVVVLNFTLQFIEPEHRLQALQEICAGMNPGGALILSEKVKWEDPAEDQWFIDVHHDFKRANGYSDLEISQKRSALENVLVPETIAAHHQRLTDAGFSNVKTWYQCLNFCSFIAIK